MTQIRVANFLQMFPQVEPLEGPEFGGPTTRGLRRHPSVMEGTKHAADCQTEMKLPPHRENSSGAPSCLFNPSNATWRWSDQKHLFLNLLVFALPLLQTHRNRLCANYRKLLTPFVVFQAADTVVLSTCNPSGPGHQWFIVSKVAQWVIQTSISNGSLVGLSHPLSKFQSSINTVW